MPEQVVTMLDMLQKAILVVMTGVMLWVGSSLIDHSERLAQIESNRFTMANYADHLLTVRAFEREVLEKFNLIMLAIERVRTESQKAMSDVKAEIPAQVPPQWVADKLVDLATRLEKLEDKKGGK